jgi:hypothetical protein
MDMPNTSEEILAAISNNVEDIYKQLSRPTCSEIALCYPALYSHFKIEYKAHWDLIWGRFSYCDEKRMWNHYQCEFLNAMVAGNATDDNCNGIIVQIEHAVSEACWNSEEFNKDKDANDRLSEYLMQANAILLSMKDHEISFKETEAKLNKFLEDFNNRKK